MLNLSSPASGNEENTFTAGGGLRACKQLEQAPRSGRAGKGGRSPGRAWGAAAAQGRWWGAAGPGRVPRGLYGRGGGSGACVAAATAGGSAEVERRGALSRKLWPPETPRQRGHWASRSRGVSDADPGLQGDPPGRGGGPSTLPHFPGSLARAVT